MIDIVVIDFVTGATGVKMPTKEKTLKLFVYWISHVSLTIAQCNFIKMFDEDVPRGPTISQRYSDFKARWFICKEKSTGHPNSKLGNCAACEGE